MRQNFPAPGTLFSAGRVVTGGKFFPERTFLFQGEKYNNMISLINKRRNRGGTALADS